MSKVKVCEGVLEGELKENEYFGGQFHSFKGIPYAEPPVGDLRFQAPQPPKQWNGIRSAKKFGPICFQSKPGTGKYVGSEDCLYLNVYTPKLNQNKLLPVMFWIHGGFYQKGHGNDSFFGPEFLVRHDVILVTMNYRLEILGFLCLHSKEVPGNAGMKDQVAALRWVNGNISNFGGDPENITIFGNSAGSTCVSLHLISPMSKGLFKRAIAQSGAASCPWAIDYAPKERAMNAAKQLGLISEDSQTLYDFFKSQPVQSLVDIRVPLTLNEYAKQGSDIYFNLVSENDYIDVEKFFSGNFNQVLRNGIHNGVELLSGFNEHEGLVSLITEKDKCVEIFIDSLNYIYDIFLPRNLQIKIPLYQQVAIGKSIQKYYLKNEYLSKYNIEKVIDYFTLIFFLYDIIQMNKTISGLKRNKLYFYKFTCKSNRNVTSSFIGVQNIFGDKTMVCHSDELLYLFPFRILQQQLEEGSIELLLVNNVTKLWTNFAKTGNPTPDDSLNITWKEFTLESQHYLEIGNELVLKTKPHYEEILFWEEIYRKVSNHTILNKL